MKKILSVIIAVVIAFSSLTVMSFAIIGDETPVFSLSTDKTSAIVGDVVKAEVKVAKDSRMCTATFNVVYDNDCFEVASVTASNAMTAELNKEYKPSGATSAKVRYVGVNVDMLNDAATLLTVEFKVIKTGGSISLELEEIVGMHGMGTNYTYDVTADSVKAMSNSSVKVNCAHVKETVIVENATCTKAGSKYEKCTQCDWKADPVEIPQLPHEFETVEVKKATCAAPGSKQDVCKKCGWKADPVEIPQLPHKIEKIVLQSATCKAEGSYVEMCTVCDWESKPIAIPMVAHEMEQVDKKPTCEKDGLKADKCKNCDYQINEVVVPATGHTEGDWVVVKKPTKTEKGLEQKKCTVCEKVLDEKELPELPAEYRLGDLNGDGEPTAIDARMILRFVAGLEKLNSTQMIAADVNGDGAVTAKDSRMILQYVVGKVKF